MSACHQQVKRCRCACCTSMSQQCNVRRLLHFRLASNAGLLGQRPHDVRCHEVQACSDSDRGWVRSKQCNTCKPQDCKPQDCEPQAMGHRVPRGRLQARPRGARAPAAPAPATRCMHQCQHSIRRKAHASVRATARTRVRFASRPLGRAHGQARQGCARIDALDRRLKDRRYDALSTPAATTCTHITPSCGPQPLLRVLPTSAAPAPPPPTR